MLMCKSKNFPLHARFVNCLLRTMICMAALWATVAAKAQDQCAVELENARQRLNAGLFNEVVELAGRCLSKSGLTPGEKINAYWFIVMAYVGDDSLRRAEEAMCNLVKSVPSYQPRPDDPPPLIELYKKAKEKCQPPIPSTASERKNDLVLGYGLALPMSPERFGSRYRPGFNITGGLGVRLNPHLMLGGEIAYSRLGQKVESSRTGITHGDGVSLLEILGIARYHFNSMRGSTQFYILGGAGANFVKFAAVTERLFSGAASPRTAAAERQTGALVAAGVGLKFAIHASIALFVESRCHLIFVANDDLVYLPLKTGILF